MEEKILIKSEIDKTAKAVFKTLITFFFVLPAIFAFILSQEKEYGFYGSTRTGFESAFHGDGLALALLIIACCSLVLAIVLLIVFIVHNKCELTITDKNARGKAIFGKEVVLPIYMVSAYSTRRFMSTIAVASSSGLTKFSFIGNYAEIGKVLSELINKRQDKTETAASEPKAANSNMDDLVKLKNLLDSGIITEEEFEAKKKQLLGL